MAFRSSEYLQRNELVRYQLDDVIRSPGNNQHQVKNGYKFTINDRSSFYDWYNAYFVSSVGRVPDYRARGREFKPRPDLHSGSLNN